MRLELASENGRRLQFADLPVEPDTLSQFAQGVIDGQSLVGGVPHGYSLDRRYRRIMGDVVAGSLDYYPPSR